MGQVGKLLVQAIYFSVLARALGTAGYGAFVSVVALASLAGPLATLGSGQILIQKMSGSSVAFEDEFGRALSITCVASSGLALVVTAFGRLLLPVTVPTILIASVVFADVVFASFLSLSGMAYQAVGRMQRTAQFQILWSVLKLLAAAILLARLFELSVARWGQLYLGATAVGAAFTLLLVSREVGRPRFSTITPRFAYFAAGAYFAFGEAAKTVYDDIDKAMLARFASLEAAGLYGAAYRVIELCLAPIRALLAATFSGFFRAGSRGIRGSFDYGKKFIVLSMSYGLLASVLIFFTAPLIPLLLGSEFAVSVQAVKLLAVLPALKAGHYVIADTLTGAGLQVHRTLAQIAIATFNVVACILWLPKFGWTGAAVISIGSDGALLLLFSALVWWNYRGNQVPSSGTADAAT